MHDLVPGALKGLSYYATAFVILRRSCIARRDDGNPQMFMRAGMLMMFVNWHDRRTAVL